MTVTLTSRRWPGTVLYLLYCSVQVLCWLNPILLISPQRCEGPGYATRRTCSRHLFYFQVLLSFTAIGKWCNMNNIAAARAMFCAFHPRRLQLLLCPSRYQPIAVQQCFKGRAKKKRQIIERQKWPKISTNSVESFFFCPKAKKSLG